MQECMGSKFLNIYYTAHANENIEVVLIVKQY